MSAWIQLPHLAALKLRGPDASAFAHAQFTTSFQDGPTPGWGLTAWCNPKGRALAVILARVHEQGVDLVLPSEQLDTIARQLPLYAIGRQVEVSRETQVAGCFETARAADLSLHADPQRALCLEPEVSEASPDGVIDWRKSDLCAGIAWLTPSGSGQFLPQALGLEERNGLSYQKGCYPGQEVIARVHYLGRGKERLSAFRLETAVDCADQTLRDEEDARVGSVVQSLAGSATTIGLAVVRNQYPAGQDVRCAGTAGTLCEPEELRRDMNT